MNEFNYNQQKTLSKLNHQTVDDEELCKLFAILNEYLSPLQKNLLVYETIRDHPEVLTTLIKNCTERTTNPSLSQYLKSIQKGCILLPQKFESIFNSWENINEDISHIFQQHSVPHDMCEDTQYYSILILSWDYNKNQYKNYKYNLKQNNINAEFTIHTMLAMDTFTNLRVVNREHDCMVIVVWLNEPLLFQSIMDYTYKLKNQPFVIIGIRNVHNTSSTVSSITANALANCAGALAYYEVETETTSRKMKIRKVINDVIALSIQKKQHQIHYINSETQIPPTSSAEGEFLPRIQTPFCLIN